MQMTCKNCVDAICNSLHGVEGITSFTVDPNSEQVTLETTLSTRQVQNLLETSGRTAILRGLGPAGKDLKHLGAAVVEMRSGIVKGVTRFVQVS